MEHTGHNQPGYVIHCHKTNQRADGSANITPGIYGVLPIANGGTGASSAAAARNALGIVSALFTRIAYGFIGDVSGTTKTINMGFRPQVLFLCYQGNRNYTSLESRGAYYLNFIALSDTGHENEGQLMIEYTNTGFTTYYDKPGGVTRIQGIAYIAFG